MSANQETVRPMQVMPRGIYTCSQVAELAQVSVSSVRRACAAGRLRAGRPVQSWRIVGADLLDWARGEAPAVAPDSGEPAGRFPELTAEDIEELCAHAGGDDG